MIELVPGEDYAVRTQGSRPGEDFYYAPAIYVRAERIGGLDWHVFAFKPLLFALGRVRVPCRSATIDGKVVSSEEGVVSKGLYYERDDPERLPSVNAFIDEAVRLAREKPAPANTYLYYLQMDLERLAAD